MAPLLIWTNNRPEAEGPSRIVKGIKEAYAKAEEESSGFQFTFQESCQTFDQMLSQLPDRFWIE